MAKLPFLKHCSRNFVEKLRIKYLLLHREVRISDLRENCTIEYGCKVAPVDGMSDLKRKKERKKERKQKKEREKKEENKERRKERKKERKKERRKKEKNKQRKEGRKEEKERKKQNK